MKISSDDIVKINQLYPSMREDAKCFLCEAADLNAFIFSGLRTYEEQTKLYSQGRTTTGDIVTNARPGQSWHNFGIAMDVVFKNSVGEWTWDDKEMWDELGKLGEKHRFHWGGRFRGFVDLPHFDRNYGFSLEELNEIYSEHEQLSDVWTAINNYGFKA